MSKHVLFFASILLTWGSPPLSAAILVDNPIQPNPVTSLAKRGALLCGNFGRGAILLNTQTGTIATVQAPETINNVFAWGADSWGLLSSQKLYRWMEGERLEQIAVGKEPFKFGIEAHGRVFLKHGREIAEVSQSGELNKVQVRDYATDSANEFGWWHGKLVTFGNGIYSLDLSAVPPTVRQLANNFWATTGLVVNEGELIAGGGGWHPLVIGEPRATQGTRFDYTQKATYDQVQDFDWEAGEYWIASSLTGEGAIWSGNSNLRNPKRGQVVNLPPVRWSDFKVMGDKIYLANPHGLLEIAMGGTASLITRISPDSPVGKRLANDLNWGTSLLVRKEFGWRTFAGGQFDWSRNQKSFLLERDKNGTYSMLPVPIEGLRDIVLAGKKVVLIGRRTYTYEGGEWQHMGGIAVIDAKSSTPEPILNVGVFLNKIEGDTLWATAYEYADDIGNCFKEYSVELNLENQKIANDKTEYICREGNLGNQPQTPYIQDQQRFSAAKEMLGKDSAKGDIGSFKFEGEAGRIPINVSTTISDDAITAVTVPLNKPQ